MWQLKKLHSAIGNNRRFPLGFIQMGHYQPLDSQPIGLHSIHLFRGVYGWKDFR